jgi:TOBE domain
VVRPESCGLTEDVVTVHGRVIDVSFVGPSIHIAFATADDAVVLHASVPGHASNVEQATTIGFDPVDAWLVREDDAA